MAKTLKELDGKRIIHDYAVQLLAKDAGDGKKHKLVLPPYMSVGITSKTDIGELTNKNSWLERNVSV